MIQTIETLFLKGFTEYLSCRRGNITRLAGFYSEIQLEKDNKMGVTKSDLFTEKQNELSNVAKVFAHPARIAIIQYLLKSNTCFNGHLVEELGLAQPTISQHLRELKNSGIIQGTIEGVSVSYCINPQRWAEIKLQFNLFFEELTPPSGEGDCC